VSPQRIQRRRTKGWRIPEGAVYVGRPTMFGNPYRIGQAVWIRSDNEWERFTISTRQVAVSLYRRWAMADTVDLHDFPLEHVYLQHALAVRPLGGHDLVCWCPLDEPCHADVLLELANRGMAA